MSASVGSACLPPRHRRAGFCPSVRARPVEVMLPAGVLQQFEVTLDYAHRTLTLATPSGDCRIDGPPVPCTINPKTGFVTGRRHDRRTRLSGRRRCRLWQRVRWSSPLQS